jgi:hypothetical protein
MKYALTTIFIAVLVVALAVAIYTNYRDGRSLEKELAYQQNVTSIVESFRSLDFVDEDFHVTGDWSANKISVMMRLRVKYEQFDNHAIAYLFLEVINAGSPSDEIEILFESLSIDCKRNGAELEGTVLADWSQPHWGGFKIPENGTLCLPVFDRIRSCDEAGNYVFAGGKLYSVDPGQQVTIAASVDWSAGEYGAAVELPPIALF